MGRAGAARPLPCSLPACLHPWPHGLAVPTSASPLFRAPLSTLQEELRPILLRRMKEDVETLPEKEEVSPRLRTFSMGASCAIRCAALPVRALMSASMVPAALNSLPR